MEITKNYFFALFAPKRILVGVGFNFIHYIKKVEFISLNLFVAEDCRSLDSASIPLILVLERANG